MKRGTIIRDAMAFIQHGLTGRHRHWPRTTCLWQGGCPAVRRGAWFSLTMLAALTVVALVAARG